MGATLQFERVHKRYGDVAALAGVSLTIQGGEFFTLLGPSGCGKTTLLRCVAGFLRPDDGRILCDGDRLDRLPAHKRDIGMVFQNYAIFPHLTVFENVAYGLRARRVEPAESRRRALETLTRVQMDALADRRPDQLSGGQQQRVALARAIVFKPRLLLMDEPLGALDALTREQAQELILDVWRRTSKMVFFITHSVEEALFLATRLVVMTPRPGRIAKTYDLDFGRRYLACRDARKVKSEPAFIRMREQVLADILSRDASAGAFEGGST